MKRTVINRMEFLKLFLTAIGILLGIVGLAVSVKIIVAIGIILALIALLLPKTGMNPYKSCWLDSISYWFRMITTGYLWTHIQKGDIFTFSTVAYPHTDEDIMRTMTVEVVDKGMYFIILKYSGDNITLINKQEINFTRELPRHEFLKKLHHMESVEEVKWNDSVIKVKL